MKFYFDSSALLKRYVSENGSDLVDGLFLEAESVVVSSISLPEVISGLTRLRRQKSLSPHQYSLCKRAAIEEFLAFEEHPLSSDVLKMTIDVLEHCDVRAADAIHVASAIHIKADRFISGDAKQIDAARAFKLSVSAV